MMKIQEFFRVLLAVFSVLSVSTVSQAGIVNYGNFSGTNVDYIDVTDITLEPTPPGLFELVSVDGNDLVFGVQGFILQTLNGNLDFFDSRLSFVIQANPGYTFDSITIQEFGSFFTFGSQSIASVSAVAFVHSVNGLFSGSFQLDQFGSNVPVSSDWAENLTINFPSSNAVAVVLDNRLFGIADTPGVAFVDKKGLRIKVGIVPEPSSALLLGLASLTMAGFRYRRS